MAQCLPPRAWPPPPRLQAQKQHQALPQGPRGTPRWQPAYPAAVSSCLALAFAEVSMQLQSPSAWQKMVASLRSRS